MDQQFEVKDIAERLGMKDLEMMTLSKRIATIAARNRELETKTDDQTRELAQLTETNEELTRDFVVVSEKYEARSNDNRDLQGLVEKLNEELIELRQQLPNV